VPDDADLPPAVDLELQGNCSARPAAADVREEVEAFIDAVEAGTGQDVVLYVLDSWEERYPTRDLARGDRRVWQRRIGPLRPAGDWWLWQFTFEARVDGIDGPVDLNVMRP
jgi:lysozyme